MFNSLFHTVFGFLWLGFSLLTVVLVSFFVAMAAGLIHMVNMFDRVAVGR
jgi:hypothetical protein